MAQDRAVYAAEDRIQRWADLAGRHGGVSVFGSIWHPEPLARFGAVGDVAAYVQRVLNHLGHPSPVRVRARRGATRAHYESTSEPTIAVPPAEIGGSWALQELVVLHELAHHLAPPADDPHGPVFRRTLVDLLEATNHPVLAHLAVIAFTDAGLPPAPARVSA